MNVLKERLGEKCEESCLSKISFQVLTLLICTRLRMSVAQTNRPDPHLSPVFLKRQGFTLWPSKSGASTIASDHTYTLHLDLVLGRTTILGYSIRLDINIRALLHVREPRLCL
jgi:hypothetical protein